MSGSLVKLDEKWGKRDVELSSFSPLTNGGKLVRGTSVSRYSSTTIGSIGLGGGVGAVKLVGSRVTASGIKVGC